VAVETGSMSWQWRCQEDEFGTTSVNGECLLQNLLAGIN